MSETLTKIIVDCSTGVTSGVANTGSGGGGAAGTNATAPPHGVAGAGGSGLVIVRYSV